MCIGYVNGRGYTDELTIHNSQQGKRKRKEKMSELSPLTEGTDGTASLTIETGEKETGEEENEKETETEDNDSLVFATDAEKISDIMSNDPNATRSNTPSKGKRQRVCKSDTWKHVKRLGKDLQSLHPEKSHICIHCNSLLKLYKTGSTWSTTAGNSHLQSCGEYIKATAEGNAKCEAVEKSMNRKLKKQEKVQTLLFQPHSSSSVKSGSSVVVGGFTSKLRNDALAGQCRWYIYSGQRVSKRTFEDRYWLEMMSLLYKSGGGKACGNDFPRLTVKQLKFWLQAEYENFKKFLKYSVKEMVVFTEGNPFAQCIHDCATLVNKHKCLALGMQFTHCTTFKNFALCLGMKPVTSGTNVAMAAHITSSIADLLGYDKELGHKLYKDLFCSVISDLAAIGTAEELSEVEGDGYGCSMHQGDKIGRSAVGDLTRSKGKKVVNPFPEGQRLMLRCHNMAKFFSYSNRLLEMRQLYAATHIGESVAGIKLQLDLNTTRVAARYGLLTSVIRLNKGLSLYGKVHNKDWQLDDQEWESVVEFHAILGIGKWFTTFVQHERSMTTAFSVPMKRKLLEQLRGESIQVVDLDKVTDAPKLPTKTKLVSDMTEIGRECLERAKLEAERRFAGNKTEELTNADVVLEKREGLSMLLDPRTLVVLCNKIGMTKQEKQKYMEALKVEYVDYATRAKKKREEKAGVTHGQDIKGNEMRVDVGTNAAKLGLDVMLEDDDDISISSTESQNDEVVFGKEFDRCYKNYKMYCCTINWEGLYSDEFKEGEGSFPMNLVNVDMTAVFNMISNKNKEKRSFGWLPVMAIASKGSIGSLLASSFCERINSAANLVCTDGNSLLDPEEVDKLVTLRMNREYMEFMRENCKMPCKDPGEGLVNVE